MTLHRKKCPRVVHFNVPRDWFETNSRHQKHYSEGGKKIVCHGVLGRVISQSLLSPLAPRFGHFKVARAINTDVWQAVVARAIESQKISREPP